MKYLITIIFGFAIWFFGAILILQDMFLHKIFFSSGVVKMLFAIQLILLWLSDSMSRIYFTKFKFVFFVLWGLYILSLFVVFTNYAIISDYGLIYFLYSLNTVHFYLIISILIVLYPQKKSDISNKVSGLSYQRLVFVLFVPLMLALFGIVQHLSGNLFFSENYLGYINHVNIEFIAGGTRAISIFSSGWTFSEMSLYFLSFCLISLSVAKYRNNYSLTRLTLFFFLFIFIASIYMSLIRVSMIQLILVFMGYYFVLKKTSPIKYVAASFFFSLIIFIAISLLTYLDGYELLGGEGLMNLESIRSRQNHWMNAFGNIIQNINFGTGFSVTHQMQINSDDIVVDNFLLSLMLFGGVYNTLFSVGLYVLLFYFVVSKAYWTENFYWRVLSVFYFSIPVGALFMDQHNTPMLLFFLTFLITLYSHNRKAVRWSNRFVQPS